jgi:hypothetical protein
MAVIFVEMTVSPLATPAPSTASPSPRRQPPTTPRPPSPAAGHPAPLRALQRPAPSLLRQRYAASDHAPRARAGDNGPEDPHIYMNSVGDPGPFRGRKRSLYDGGVRRHARGTRSRAPPHSSRVVLRAWSSVCSPPCQRNSKGGAEMILARTAWPPPGSNEI